MSAVTTILESLYISPDYLLYFIESIGVAIAKKPKKNNKKNTERSTAPF